MAAESPSYSPMPSPDHSAAYSPTMPPLHPVSPSWDAALEPPSPAIEAPSPAIEEEEHSKAAPDGGEALIEESSDEDLRSLSRHRQSAIGEVDLDSVSSPPSLWQSSPAHIECTAVAPEYEGNLPSHAMRRLDVGQRSAVGDFQSAVRNLTDFYCSPPMGVSRGARREKKALEKRARSAAQRMWVAVKREDDRWKDLATASHHSLDKQRLLLATLRSQEKLLASRQ